MPSQQVRGVPGRDHPGQDEPRVRTRDHQHRAAPSSRPRAGFLRRNHRSHCAASPGSHVSRSAGSTGRCSGRSRRTLSRNQVIDPVHPTRSAITVAGMSGVAIELPHQRLERRNAAAPPPARTSVAGPKPTPARPSTYRSPNPVRPDAAEHRPRPAAKSEPNPPLRYPYCSGWPRFQASLWPRFGAEPKVSPMSSSTDSFERSRYRRSHQAGAHRRSIA